MTIVFGALGVSPTLRGQPTNVFTLAAGQVEYIPAGTWAVQTGKYSQVQEYDPITTIWRGIGDDSAGSTFRYVNSDGANYRVANQTGCVVGAEVTTAGSGYTSAPTITDNGGSATYLAIVGGAVNTSITVTNGGTGYTYAPNVQFSAPPTPGVQATGYATIAAGIVTAVTVTNQGAGYSSAPTITFTNDNRDTTGTNASATSVLISGGTITAVLVTNHGTAVASVPTLTFSGGGGTGGAATAIMCFTTTAYTVTSAGSNYAGNTLITGMGVRGTSLASYTNPAIQGGLVRMRPAYYAGSIASTSLLTSAGQVLYDGGIFPVVPTGYVAGYNAGSSLLSSAAQVSFTCGGVTDTVLLFAV